MTTNRIPDPELDLVFERTLDIPREKIWDAWTKPELILEWFTPAPWKTVDCEIDLKPGGTFRTVMQSEEGQSFDHLGTYLEVVKNERLVWTDTLGPGYRPGKEPFITAIITLETHGKGTKYRAVVLHKDIETRKKH